MVYHLLLPTDTNPFTIEAPKFELDAYIANYRGGPFRGPNVVLCANASL